MIPSGRVLLKQFEEVIKANPGISALPSAVRSLAGYEADKMYNNTYARVIKLMKDNGLIIEINGRFYHSEVGSKHLEQQSHQPGCICRKCEEMMS